MEFGYCRVSTSHQRIVRQVNNIKEKYPRANIIKEFYTGTTQQRPPMGKDVKTTSKGRHYHI